ncbi:hypothetical protein [Lysinibacillus sp. 54212]
MVLEEKTIIAKRRISGITLEKTKNCLIAPTIKQLGQTQLIALYQKTVRM